MLKFVSTRFVGSGIILLPQQCLGCASFCLIEGNSFFFMLEYSGQEYEQGAFDNS